MTGSNSTELNGPRGVSFTVNGDCLIAEYLGHCVQLCPVEGDVCTTVAGTGVAGSGNDQLNGPVRAVEIATTSTKVQAHNNLSLETMKQNWNCR